MATAPKSILKQPTASRRSNSPEPEQVDSSRNYQLALHHANLIQERKDYESQILSSLEALLDLPTSSKADSTHPNPSDLSFFQSCVQPFQVSDYDALIEERNCADKCGYVFCSNPLRSGSTPLIREPSHGATRNGIRLTTERKRKFCTSDCARRALFVKVQLSEVPAWERAASSAKSIEVLDESSENALRQKLTQIQLQDPAHIDVAHAMQELALERGETEISKERVQAVMTADVQENPEIGTLKPFATQLDGAGTIEGYRPKTWLIDRDDM